MMIDLTNIELIAPTLAKCLADKTIYVKNGEFIGRASDGIEVSFGDAYNIPNTEQYLKANPTPEQW